MLPHSSVRLRTSALTLALLVSLAPVAWAQQNFEAVQIDVVEVAPGVLMLVGQGGNIGVSYGADGVFLVDDQFAPLTEKILAAIRTVSDMPVRFVLNTHWHGDHTGGNENLGARGALIVAHENVRSRMSVEQFMGTVRGSVPAAPEGALPVITFTDAMTFHWNGEVIHVFHAMKAHTDGDAIVHFRNANVVHMGDTYFNGMYPFIDVNSGGNIEGIIAVADAVLALSDGDTRIIPGHGPLSNRAELSAYRNMLVEVRAQVEDLIAQGKTQEEIVAARVTQDLDADWGGGFMNPDTWIGLVYMSVKED